MIRTTEMDFVDETLTPYKFQELAPAEIIGSGFLYILNIFPIAKIFFKKTPEKILVLDMDNTLLHQAKSSCPDAKEPELLFEEQFRAMLKQAKKTNTLVVIGTARYLHNQHLCSSAQSISETIKKLEDGDSNLISAIIYTNNSSKRYLLTWLAKYYHLSHDHVCLVDDNGFHRNEVARSGFPAVNILGAKPFEKMLKFLDAPATLAITEPTTPVVLEKYGLFSMPKRQGFAGLRTGVRSFNGSPLLRE